VEGKGATLMSWKKHTYQRGNSGKRGAQIFEKLKEQNEGGLKKKQNKYDLFALKVSSTQQGKYRMRIAIIGCIGGTWMSDTTRAALGPKEAQGSPGRNLKAST